MARLEDVIERLGDAFKVDVLAYAYMEPSTVGELRAFVELLDVLGVDGSAPVEDGSLYVKLDRPGVLPHFSYCANHFYAEGDKFIVGSDLHDGCGDD